VGTRFAAIDAELQALTELRDKPSGRVRITADSHALDTLLWPKLAGFLSDFPGIQVEVIIDDGLTDIVTEQFDAGVRLGELVAKDLAQPHVAECRLQRVREDWWPCPGYPSAGAGCGRRASGTAGISSSVDALV
jgi:DNA-binding transcriptional LysR family regulator